MFAPKLNPTFTGTVNADRVSFSSIDGTKLSLYPDYDVGMEDVAMWNSIAGDASPCNFKWYAGIAPKTNVTSLN